MSIANEGELRHSLESLSRLYNLASRVRETTIGDPDTTRDQADGVDAMISKIERQVAEYLASKYELIPAERAKAAA